MKKFKSILAITASVLALSAFAAPLSAFAQDTGGGTITFDGTNQTLNPQGTANAFDVSDTVSAGYWVSIPANVDFTDTSTTSNKEVKAALDSQFTKGVVLTAGHKLKIEVKSTNGLQLKDNTGNYTLAPYSFTAVATKNSTIVNAGDESSKTFSNTSGDGNIPMTANTNVPLAIFNNNSFDTVTLAFTEGVTSEVPAGSYTDTLTFTISTPELQ